MKEVNQFPSDIECMRYIATIADKVKKKVIIVILMYAIFELMELVKIFPEM